MPYEHKLYEIEKWKDDKIVERQIVLTTPKKSTWYALQGWHVFDFHDSLGMDSEIFETEIESTLYKHQ